MFTVQKYTICKTSVGGMRASRPTVFSIDSGVEFINGYLLLISYFLSLTY